jgi:diaminopimelate epimerase
MRQRFTKMHGLGNDFVVFDATRAPVELTPEALRLVAHRRYGVGCDQILKIEPAREAGTDFHYRIFNADGGEVEQCGNGARCFARYVRERGLTQKREIRVGTLAGVIVLRLEPDGQVTVDMGVPVFEPARVPFLAPAEALTYEIELNSRMIVASVLSMGNPHVVQTVPDIEHAPVATEGPQLERHPRFPQRVNAGYMQVLGPRRIRLRVHERGAGETLACGTGACAAVVAGVMRGVLEPGPVEVETRGGVLVISWRERGEPVMMTGPAVIAFEGEIDLEAAARGLPPEAIGQANAQ